MRGAHNTAIKPPPQKPTRLIESSSAYDGAAQTATSYRLSLVASSSIIERLERTQETLLLSSRPYSFPGGPYD